MAVSAGETVISAGVVLSSVSPLIGSQPIAKSIDAPATNAKNLLAFIIVCFC
jgi:hypothetical protein